MVENRIEELLLEKFKEDEFKDCFLIEINMTSKKTIEIILDADDGLTLEKCQRISRYIENYLDTELPMGDDYTIEVSSPGVSRPLMYQRQYPKHIGRTLQITCHPEKLNLEQNVIAKDEATEGGVIEEDEAKQHEANNSTGEKIEGKLLSLDNQQITLEFEEIRKEGKKKIKETIQKVIPFEKINKAFVKLAF